MGLGRPRGRVAAFDIAARFQRVFFLDGGCFAIDNFPGVPVSGDRGFAREEWRSVGHRDFAVLELPAICAVPEKVEVATLGKHQVHILLLEVGDARPVASEVVVLGHVERLVDIPDEVQQGHQRLVTIDARQLRRALDNGLALPGRPDDIRLLQRPLRNRRPLGGERKVHIMPFVEFLRACPCIVHPARRRHRVVRCVRVLLRVEPRDRRVEFRARFGSQPVIRDFHRQHVAQGIPRSSIWHQGNKNQHRNQGTDHPGNLHHVFCFVAQFVEDPRQPGRFAPPPRTSA